MCLLVVSPRASIRYHCLAYFQLIIGYGYQCVPFIAITLAIEIVCSIWCRPVFLIRLKISNPHECTGRIAFVCAFYCVILFDAIDCAHEISVTEALEIYLFTSTTRIWAHDICFDFLDPIPCIAFVPSFSPNHNFSSFYYYIQHILDYHHNMLPVPSSLQDQSVHHGSKIDANDMSSC